jgi:hypothetical protein
VDNYLLETMKGASLTLHEPRDEGAVFYFDRPWEGAFCAYCTVISDGGKLRAYYRGKPNTQRDGVGEVTCVAESADGKAWTKPNLRIIEVEGNPQNNAVLASDNFSHNFSPLLDANPKALGSERYKALAGTMVTGLFAFGSADGLQWKKLQETPVLTTNQVPFPYMFDSQNVAFWSLAEERYVMFFRVFKEGVRRVARAESADFVHWKKVELMQYRDAADKETVVEHLYTSQTHAYFRAPHIYVALAARFLPGRQVLTAKEAEAINVHPSYFKDASDAVFMTSRGGNVYQRTFLEGFIRPGLGAENWVSRTTYPALNVVQTGPAEMSVYVNQAYAQPTAHLRRYSLRLDGFSSLRGPYSGGEVTTKPITFAGERLKINFATSAAGSVRVEIQEESGKAVPGFALEQSRELIGNEIERTVSWNDGSDVSAVSGKPVRLRFALKDADLYSFHFDKSTRRAK